MGLTLIESVKMVGNNNLFLIYLILLFIDIIAGKYRAMLRKNFQSDYGLNGLARHFTLLILIFGVLTISNILDYEMLGQAFIIFYILDYSTSIIENLTIAGVDFPDTITKYINTERKKYAQSDKDEWGL